MGSNPIGRVLMGAVILLSSTIASAATVYNVNRVIGAGTVVGTITTNGNTGVLQDSDIDAWSFTLTSTNLDISPVIIASSDLNYTPIVSGTAFTATASDLLFDFGAAGSNHVLFWTLPYATGHYWCLDANGACLAPGLSDGEMIGRGTSSSVADFAAQTGNTVVASVVPIPAAAWLFGSGLIGLAAMKRKRS